VDTLGAAREQFLGLVREIRPELHRYCARLVGSIIEGEDVVQDVLAKVRGRAALRAAEATARASAAPDRALLDAYVRLFNARDWDGVRALIGEDCRLDLVSKSQRRGRSSGLAATASCGVTAPRSSR
jgi:RNA polymerase sigma-70 factor (ECF subfamily)